MNVRGGRIFRGGYIAGIAAVMLACAGAPKGVHLTASPGITINLNALRAQVAANFVGEEHSRKRKIQGYDLAATVKIRAVAHSEVVDSASGPSTPMIVAWIQNQNNVVQTADPNFKRKNDAEYIVQIYRDSATGTARYQMLEIPSSASGSLSVIKTGAIIPCTPTHRPYPAHDADFKSCDGTYHEPYGTLAAGGRPERRMNSMSGGGLVWAASYDPMSSSHSYHWNSALRTNAYGEDATWIDCNAGCCTLAGT